MSCSAASPRAGRGACAECDARVRRRTNEGLLRRLNEEWAPVCDGVRYSNHTVFARLITVYIVHRHTAGIRYLLRNAYHWNPPRWSDSTSLLLREIDSWAPRHPPRRDYARGGQRFISCGTGLLRCATALLYVQFHLEPTLPARVEGLVEH